MPRWFRLRSGTVPAASMPPWANTRICWPIWCVACWKTERIPPSSTASPTPICRWRRCWPIRSNDLATPTKPHPRIPLPRDLFCSAGAIRKDSISTTTPPSPACRGHRRFRRQPITAVASSPAAAAMGKNIRSRSPADQHSSRWLCGQCQRTGCAPKPWPRLMPPVAAGTPPPAEQRAALLEQRRRSVQQRLPELIALIVARRRPTPRDALPKCAKPIDFLPLLRRPMRAQNSPPRPAARPDRRANSLGLSGRGVFVCISPWNFPLAIFIGQIAAALAAGNAVVAKPAEQTPLIGAWPRSCCTRPACPATCCTSCPATAHIGAALVATSARAPASPSPARPTRRRRSTAPGRQRTGADRAADRRDRRPERADRRFLRAARAGGRAMCCSRPSTPPVSAARPLRVLFLQDDIADKVIAMLAGRDAANW